MSATRQLRLLRALCRDGPMPLDELCALLRASPTTLYRDARELDAIGIAIMIAPDACHCDREYLARWLGLEPGREGARRVRRPTVAIRAATVARYQAGEEPRAIAAALGTHRATVYVHLRAAGIALRTAPPIDWGALPLGEVPDRVIAEQLGCSLSRVQSARWRYGIPSTRTRGA